MAVRPILATTEKLCTKCRAIKPVEDFAPRKNRPGRESRRRACANAAGRSYYRNNRAKVDTRCRRWRAANPDKITEYSNKHSRTRRPAERAAIIAYYSNGTMACACCGATERLSIDHIAGNGGEHRADIGSYGSGSTSFSRWLVMQGFPPGYQVLCRSCNASKRETSACRLHNRSDVSA